MNDKGYLTVQVYTARMSIPLRDVSVTITMNDKENNTKSQSQNPNLTKVLNSRGRSGSTQNPNQSQRPIIIAHRTTDQNGKTMPLELPTPIMLNSTKPGSEDAFTSCNIQIDHPLYRSIRIIGVQIFPGEESLQQAELLPLPEFAPQNSKSQSYVITPQDL